MDEFKRYLVQHLEKILIVIILIATFIGTYFIEEKLVILNFYYLPVLEFALQNPIASLCTPAFARCLF